MKDRKMANLPSSKSKPVLLIVQQRTTNPWREDEYTDIKCVNISIIQVNYSNSKYRETGATNPERGTYRRAVTEKHMKFSNPLSVVSLIQHIFGRMNIHLQYENDALDGIERQEDKPSVTSSSCSREFSLVKIINLCSGLYT